MLTAQQIVTEACAIAKARGFTAQGGRALNLALDDLCLHRNLQMNRTSTTVAVTANSNGPFALTNDYLRTYDLFYEVNNLPYFLRQWTRADHDAAFKDPSLANYPYRYAVDTVDLATSPSAGVPDLYIYPQSSGALTLTHRYFIRRADISTPGTSSTVPWFQDQDYLITATAMRLMKITDDQRYDKFRLDCEEMLRPHLIMEGTEQPVVKRVLLDHNTFRMTRKLRETKETG